LRLSHLLTVFFFGLTLPAVKKTCSTEKGNGEKSLLIINNIEKETATKETKKNIDRKELYEKNLTNL